MLPQLQAERQLAAIEAASIPHMTDAARNAVFNRHTRALRRDDPEPKAGSAVEALTRAGIPIVTEPAKKKGPK